MQQHLKNDRILLQTVVHTPDVFALIQKCISLNEESIELAAESISGLSKLLLPPNPELNLPSNSIDLDHDGMYILSIVLRPSKTDLGKKT